MPVGWSAELLSVECFLLLLELFLLLVLLLLLLGFFSGGVVVRIGVDFCRTVVTAFGGFADVPQRCTHGPQLVGGDAGARFWQTQ
jgi:hypothetical protein